MIKMHTCLPLPEHSGLYDTLEDALEAFLDIAESYFLGKSALWWREISASFLAKLIVVYDLSKIEEIERIHNPKGRYGIRRHHETAPTNREGAAKEDSTFDLSKNLLPKICPLIPISDKA